MLLWRGVSLIENGRANARVSCNPRHQDARSNMQESARGLSPIGANLSQYGLKPRQHILALPRFW